MKKNVFRTAFTVLVLAVLTVVFAVFCSAEKTLVADGYCVSGKDSQGNITTTNIKWEVYNEDGNVVLYFSIDSSIGGDNTVLHVRQKSGDELVYWNSAHYKTSPWGEYTVGGTPTVTKAVIGDGITSVSGAFLCGSKVTTLEIPKSLTELGSTALARASKLTTVNVRGEETDAGVINLSYVTSIGNNAFEGMNSAKKYILNPEYSEAIKYETFKQNTSLTELEIPAGVTKIDGKAFNETNAIQKIIFRGKDTVLTADSFAGLSQYPRIVGYVGSSVDSYAKSNGFTFINIETDEVVYTGSKLTVDLPSENITDTPTTDTSTDVEPTVPDDLTKFDPTGATAYGHMTGEWGGNKIIDTYWAYYSETKTLKFISNSKSYNETGSIEKCDDGVGWKEYINDIERIEVGPYISKLSHKAFSGFTSLTHVQLSTSVTQMDSGVFSYSPLVSTVWIEGNEPVEGLADFSKIKLTDCIGGSSIVEIKLSASNQNPADITFPSSLQKIITPLYNDVFDAFCKENFIDLQDSRNASNIKEYCIRLDPSWTVCGSRCAYDFDETTGTLTIYGTGATKDIVNYDGGGSKNQPWFDIKNEIKHVIFTEHMTGIGKYAFTQCKNLETVQLPNKSGFTIGSSAFRQCSSLKSIYIEGNQPIEGTLDLSTVSGDIPAYTFGQAYLYANIILGDEITAIKKYAFEGNLELNLKNIYGIPGSYAETYAADNNLTFLDSASNTPTPITCVAPVEEETADTTSSIGGDTDTVVDSEPIDTASPLDTDTTDAAVTTDSEFDIVYVGDEESEGTGTTTVVIIVVAAVIVAAVIIAVAIVVIRKKTAKKSSEKK